MFNDYIHPLVVMLKKPWEKPPSRANHRKPLDKSFSDIVGFGAKKSRNPISKYT
jgi:hypothetical protein